MAVITFFPPSDDFGASDDTSALSSGIEIIWEDEPLSSIDDSLRLRFSRILSRFKDIEAM